MVKPEIIHPTHAFGSQAVGSQFYCEIRPMPSQLAPGTTLQNFPSFIFEIYHTAFVHVPHVSNYSISSKYYFVSALAYSMFLSLPNMLLHSKLFLSLTSTFNLSQSFKISRPENHAGFVHSKYLQSHAGMYMALVNSSSIHAR